MDRIIEVKVCGNHLTKDSKCAGVKGEANVTKLRITFDEGWDGYEKKITFWDAYGLNPIKVELTTNLLENIVNSTLIYLVPIPAEPMAEAGMFTFVIDGYLENKKQRSMSDKLEVKDSPIAEDAVNSTDPTPTDLQQIQTQIEAIIDDIQDAVEAKITAETAAENAKGYADAAKTESDNAVKAKDDAETAMDVSISAKDSAEEAATQASASASAARDAEASAEKAKNTAVAARDDIQNMSVSAEALSEDEEAFVNKTEQNGVVNLHFGLPKGNNGTDGVGIKSIEQPIYATGDGDTNVMVVTLTDDTDHRFEFKNGSKGSKGDKGDPGEKGEPFTFDDLTEDQKAELKLKINYAEGAEIDTFEYIFCPGILFYTESEAYDKTPFSNAVVFSNKAYALGEDEAVLGDLPVIQTAIDTEGNIWSRKVDPYADMPEITDFETPGYYNVPWTKVTQDMPDLTDYVKNTDYATADVGGVVKTDSTLGVDINVDGTLIINKANEQEIDAKLNSYKPIVPVNLEYAVKSVGDGYYATEAQVGDINTALDSILAIQDSLIGGES